VLAAFDVLLEEVEDALRCMNNRGTQALEGSDYDTAQTAIEHARRVLMLREKIAALKGEWKDFERACNEDTASEQKTPHATSTLQNTLHTHLSPVSAKPRPVVHQEALQPVGRLIAGRIRKGLRTPEPAFFCPILQALSDLGGSAKRSEVFLILEHSMRDVLKPIDYHILSSEAEQMRWQNSAQWARNLMVKEGLLQADSPIGLWEMTEKGRVFLQNNWR
jgi:alkanesulfonate monooxygenase SsuD/methylene tetrahydromethanopterin reductase-like flavin-dependent oxidoreductase (luciferase family)